MMACLPHQSTREQVYPRSIKQAAKGQIFIEVRPMQSAWGILMVRITRWDKFRTQRGCARSISRSGLTCRYVGMFRAFLSCDALRLVEDDTAALRGLWLEKAAVNTRALQTLREIQERAKAAKRLECGDFSAAFLFGE